MGRSVETHRNAISITYLPFESEDCDDFEFFKEDIQEYLPTFFPSLDPVNGWLSYPYRETSIVLQNRQVNVCVSEYCGLVAIQVIPRDDCENESLAHKNGYYIGKKIEEIWGKLRKIGTASNGEAFFELAS